MVQELLILLIVMMLPILALMFKYQQEIESLRSSPRVPDREVDDLRTEHEEFVLGVDARIRRLEDHIRSLESTIRQQNDVIQARSANQ